ncbi:type VI secretion system Vgr family protein [Spongiivirga citrea]|uniref:Gp5/Type VI secretion system Vgr protein OB-fold domain-containing protein n=1 Tax=Spongiivirga citrea TaxID=1481457 RepID=A0A6M0CKP6_9FLAO|nr:phage baseplate assembly protein V [Spongiivirga citrea]NER18526.1 hypothetical protein [Spongiivirga citrea]
MALQSDIQIYIEGNAIHAFKRLTLHQELDSHHLLELVCRMDVLEELSGEIASESRNFLGEIVTVQVSTLDSLEGYKELEFKGVVTEVNNTKAFHQGGGDLIVIKAQSATVLADDGPHYTSYNDMGLTEILDSTFQGYDQSKLETSFSPQYSAPLHYSVQQQESAWQYASRLAAQYGEWFYYNGKALIFGKPEDGEATQLTYGQDLEEFSLKLQPSSNNYNFFTNDYLNAEQIESATSAVNSNMNGHNAFTSGKSDELFLKETAVFVNTYNDEKLQQRLDKHVENQKKAEEVNQVQINGVSDNPGVLLGNVIKIADENGAYGSYRITRVTHTATENGRYQNRFEGVTADADIYPNTNIMAYPRSQSQTAVVMDNADPDSLGRIQVQFPWQKATGAVTPWLRILTPHAGGEKGFHFIPEIDEEVLIGFEGGNAERPYVMGTLYNGNANPAGWKTDANDIKAIRTRSGHTIEFDDTDGEEKIKIYDNEGSIIIFDTKEKSLYINATENIEMAAKNIKIMAEENIEIQAKGNIETASEGDTSIQTEGNTTLQAKGDTVISSDASVTVEAKTDAEVKGQNVTAEGKVAAELKGQQTKVQGQMTVIQGASGKIDVV